MPPAKRVKRRRHAAAPPTAVTATPGTTLEEAWDEIKRLRADLDRIRASRGVPRFRAVELDPASDGTFFYECGFQPYLIWLYNNFAASSSVLTLGVGSAVADVEYPDHIYQAATAVRRSAGGQFRGSSEQHICIALATDDTNVDGNIAIDSFDSDGFTYTVASVASFDFARGFAVGY